MIGQVAGQLQKTPQQIRNVNAVLMVQRLHVIVALDPCLPDRPAPSTISCQLPSEHQRFCSSVVFVDGMSKLGSN